MSFFITYLFFFVLAPKNPSPERRLSQNNEICAPPPIPLYMWCIYGIVVRYMVQAMVNISENTNLILNIVKARYNLKDKSEAIEKVVLSCGAGLLEPELQPEFIQRMKRVSREKTINIGTLQNFKKRYGQN